MKKREIKKEENNIQLSKDDIEELSEKEEEILSRLFIKTAQIRHAPTPPPEELKQLKQIDKTFPNRIITMAEKEQKFRHRVTYFGQFNFIFLVLSGYSIAAIAGYIGSEFVGGIIAAGVSYIAYVFKTHQPIPPKQNPKTK